jgi:dTMP kinase
VSGIRVAGVFISLEGGEGAGKSTQARLLAERFRAAGHAAMTTREPGGSPGAEAIRALLLDARAGFAPTAEALLFAAARRDHVEKTILPALEAGQAVICDRFADSTRAYQGAAGAVPAETIDALETLATAGRMPDLTLVIDLPPEAGLARAALRRGASGVDRFEREDIAFHARVRQGFLGIAAAAPGRVSVIDGTGDVAAVSAAIAAAVAARGFLGPVRG